MLACVDLVCKRLWSVAAVTEQMPWLLCVHCLSFCFFRNRGSLRIAMQKGNSPRARRRRSR